MLEPGHQVEAQRGEKPCPSLPSVGMAELERECSLLGFPPLFLMFLHLPNLLWKSCSQSPVAKGRMLALLSGWLIVTLDPQQGCNKHWSQLQTFSTCCLKARGGGERKNVGREVALFQETKHKELFLLFIPSVYPAQGQPYRV